MAITSALKKQILEDGRISVEEAKQLLESARQGGGFDPRDREDLRTFFKLHESELDPAARDVVNEVLVIAVKKLIEKIEERRASFEAKGRIREFVFGIQDGTMSTVGLLAGMQGATDRPALVVLAG